MPPTHLRDAPIREAIVDIQGVTPSAANHQEILSRLKAAHEELKDRYPTAEAVEQRAIEITPTGNPKVDALILGYLFRSTGRPQKAAQFRVNGYTFSWMKPYQDWASMIAGAKDAWEVFLRTVPDFTINRVAVRFINQLSVPYPIHNNDYLLEIPKPLTTPGDYANLSSFAEQRVTLDAPSGATVGLIRLAQEPPPGAIETQAIIDIDVFRTVKINASDANKIWEILPAFQDVKNRVFYRCIGPAAIKSCGGEDTTN